MKGILRTISSLAALILPLAIPLQSQAALQAVGPISPATTLPTWYQDTTSLALGPCIDQNNFCVVTPPFDPLITNPPAPITATGPINDLNFPDESFYYLADALMNVGPNLAAKATFRAALEAAFLAGVVPNEGIVFLRINMQRIPAGLLTPNSTFTVTHPYGSFTFTSNAAGGSDGGAQTFRAEDPLAATPGAYFPPDMQAATRTGIGPFLIASGGPVTDPVTGNRYIGDPNLPTTVTGSPLGTNFFRIDGPDIGGLGINTIQTTLFNLAGKIIGLDVQPSTIMNLGPNNIVTPVPQPKTITVTNTTANSILFPTLAAAGADALDFSITPSATPGAAPFCSGATVAAAGNCSFDVTFMPVASVPAHSHRVASIALAPTTAIPPAPAGTSNPPPATLQLSGTAQVSFNATAGQHGTIDPPAQEIAAGSTLTLIVTPETKKFKIKQVADGPALVPAPFTINAGNVNHSVTAQFMPSGDLNADGALNIADALKGLRIVAGLQPADADDPDNTALKVAPLVGGVPAPDAARVEPNIADVLLILRRALSLDTW